MDKQQFTAEVLAREKTLYRTARAILREEADQQDAVQEAIAKAWAKRGSLRQPQYFATWLVRILINECNSIRRRQARIVLRGDWDAGALGASPAPDEGALDAALDALGDRLRLPVVLHYTEGFAIRDIAGMLHCTQGAVKKRLSDARKALRLEIQHEKEARTE